MWDGLVTLLLEWDFVSNTLLGKVTSCFLYAFTLLKSL